MLIGVKAIFKIFIQRNYCFFGRWITTIQLQIWYFSSKKSKQPLVSFTLLHGIDLFKMRYTRFLNIDYEPKTNY